MGNFSEIQSSSNFYKRKTDLDIVTSLKARYFLSEEKKYISYKSRHFRLFTGKKLALLGLLFRIQESIPFIFPPSVTIASSVSNVTLPKLRSITIFFPRGQSQIIYEFFQPLSDIEQVTKVRLT